MCATTLALAAASLVVGSACQRSAPEASPPPPAPRSALETLRESARDGAVEVPYACAGLDAMREVEIDRGRRVAILSCNRDGRLALFTADGALAATLETPGRPVVATAIVHDESGAALDTLLVEEFAWGTGVLSRAAVVYRFAERDITPLWRDLVWFRVTDPVLPTQYVDGFVRLSRGADEGHGPLLTYGRRDSPQAPYRERTFEITQAAVVPFAGTLE